MNIVSSSNERALLKSEGPFRITDSGDSFAGSMRSQVQSATVTTIYGKTDLYGIQVAPDEKLKEIKDRFN